MTLSIIIPVLDAEADLPACLHAIGQVDELIVVDGGSRDRSVAVATAAGARIVHSEKGRGVQLRVGAEAARGDWLLFVHADTILMRGWRAAAEAHMASAPDQAACFDFRLDDHAWKARLIEHGVAARVRLLGLPYGDQGLLVPRALYQPVGGFKPLPLMEDVDLVRRIGRRRLVMLDVAAVTSATRWRRDGWLRRSARNAACLLLYRLGLPPSRIAGLYAGGKRMR